MFFHIMQIPSAAESLYFQSMIMVCDTTLGQTPKFTSKIGFRYKSPLAKVPAKVFDSCLERYPHLYGSDSRISSCLAELGVGLTCKPNFHQNDIHGDMFGLVASHLVTPLVSLHHKTGVYTFNKREHHKDPCRMPVVFFLDNVSSGADRIKCVYEKYYENCFYDIVEPKIIQKIPNVTCGLLFKKDKIVLNKWADFSDAPTHTPGGFSS
ncbi:hypothetical protein DVH24_032298 [Malus domestica]|uniref:Uncharacterized protein n=1 Tax=Malus domestica TaxID=3750 RepID=A0A498J963_MALDO|nr:hypothetical protein DVH24_032298 [Malus domestica]